MLSVIIPVYRTNKLKITLAYLANQEFSSDFEVILVCDGAIDHRVGIGAWHNYRLRIYLKPRRLDGEHEVGAARNLGASKAKGDILLFLDEDTIPEAGSLSKFTDFCTPGVSVTGVTRRGRPEDYHWFPNSSSDACEFYGFSAITKEDFNKVGGFDEDFYGWGADCEHMNWRLIQAGIRRVCDFGIKASHQEHPRLKNEAEQQSRNYGLLLEKTGFSNVTDFWEYCRDHIEWRGFDR